MIIVRIASEKDYMMLANEDLKIEFDGECLYIHPPASKKHENVVFNLLFILKSFLEKHPALGEAIGSKFALKLPDGKRPEPDVLVVPKGVVEDDDSVYDGIPKLIVEILSPSTRDHDLVEKNGWFKENRIPEIWFVDLSASSIIIEHLQDDGTYVKEERHDGAITSHVLKGLKVPLKDILNA